MAMNWRRASAALGVSALMSTAAVAAALAPDDEPAGTSMGGATLAYEKGLCEGWRLAATARSLRYQDDPPSAAEPARPWPTEGFVSKVTPDPEAVTITTSNGLTVDCQKIKRAEDEQ